MLIDAELDALAKDIGENGLAHPVVVIDGQGEWLILDGRNRFEACRRAGVKASTEVYGGKNPVAFVVSSNLHRRHLSSSQRAMVATALANLPNGTRTTPQNGAPSPIGEGAPTQAEAATLLNVSKRSVERARRVKADGVPELAAAVVAGDVAVSAAAEVAKLPKEEQRAVVAKGKKAVATRAKEERAKAPPPSSPPLEWDEQDFLCDVRAQVDDWKREWLRHKPTMSSLIKELRLYTNLMEKENARNRASNG